MMINNTNEIAEKIVAMPILFESTQKSPLALLVESGYFEIPNAVSIEILASVLERLPDSVESWLLWSENKRSNSGWYFQRTALGEYIVGHYPFTERLPSTSYSIATVAAANFIKREVEDIRRTAREL